VRPLRLAYLGMYAVRDEDDCAPFQTAEAVQGARAFARMDRPRMARLRGREE
jgi:hypothetical protein